MDELLTDIRPIRHRIFNIIDDGPVFAPHEVDSQRLRDMLNQVHAPESVSAAQYHHHNEVATELDMPVASSVFAKCAEEERELAQSIAMRIRQLGGELDRCAATMRARVVSATGRSEKLEHLEVMIGDNLFAERAGIDTHVSITSWLGDVDPSTRGLLERIMTVKERHANEMRDLLISVNV